MLIYPRGQNPCKDMLLHSRESGKISPVTPGDRQSQAESMAMTALYPGDTNAKEMTNQNAYVLLYSADI